MANHSLSRQFADRATSFARLPKAARTASFRLAALFALLLVSAILILGGTAFWTVGATFDQHRANRVQSEIAFLTGKYQEEGLDELTGEVEERMSSAMSSGMDYLVLGASGDRLAGNMPAAPMGTGWSDVIYPAAAGAEGGAVRVLTVGLDGGIRLAVGEDLGPVLEIYAAISGIGGWLLIGAAAIGLVGGLFASSRFLRRVDALALTAEAISAGNMDRRMPLSGTNDDFDRLSTVLNRMLDRVATLLDHLRQVSTDIAHDLRTPLTRLRHILDTALSGSVPGTASHSLLEAAVGETEAILETFSALLRIAQIESGGPSAAFRDLDLSEVFETVADAFDAAASNEDKTLLRTIESGVIVHGDRQLLTQLMANLLDNAIRHTPRGTTIRVGLARTGPGAVGEVADHGPGVPAAERELIFRRFYRLERSRTSPGNGLGLALVRAIAGLHGITVSAHDNKPGY